MTIEELFASILTFVCFLFLKYIIFNKQWKQSKVSPSKWFLSIIITWFFIGLTTSQHDFILTGTLGGIMLYLIQNGGLF